MAGHLRARLVAWPGAAMSDLEALLAASIADPSARTPLATRLADPDFDRKTAAAVKRLEAVANPARQTWLDERRKGVGGSEIAAILGMDPFRGALDVYLSKVEGYDSPETEDMLRGKFMEGGVLDWCAMRTGETAYRNTHNYAHPERPLARCTPDGTATIADSSLARLVSVKCPRRGGDQWGDHDGSHRIPMHHAMQLQWEDAVLTAYGLRLDPVFHLAALIDGDLRVFHVERDTELQAVLLEQAEEWWARHVVAKVPPELDGSNGAREWLRRRFPKDVAPSRKATMAEEVLLERLSEAAQVFEAAELQRDTARRCVEEAIGASSGLEGATTRVTWRANAKNVRVFKPTYAWRAK